MSKALLSTSSLVTHVTQIPIDEYFPKNALYMRPLNVKDTEAVKVLLAKEGNKLGDAFPRYGIFDSFNGLFDLYDKHQNAVHNYEQNGYVIWWIH